MTENKSHTVQKKKKDDFAPKKLVRQDTEEETVAVDDVREIDDQEFSREIQTIIDKAEDMRLSKSRAFVGRKRLYYSILSLLVAGTSSYAVWLILMGGPAWPLSIALLATIIIPFLIHTWAQKAYREYVLQFKGSFMPALAKALGNMTFHPTGGIAAQALAPAKILPAFTGYKAEDCFRGKYKNVGIMISEARLSHKKRKGRPVFDGVFVYMATPKNKFNGHTIITADERRAKRWNVTRWKNLNAISPAAGIDMGPFSIYSDDPGEAVQLADMDLMLLLNSLVELFDNAALTIAFYGGNHVLLTIPYDQDMFEPGNIHMPVATRGHALKCKKEIEQILSVIDLLDVYEGDETLQAT